MYGRSCEAGPNEQQAILVDLCPVQQRYLFVSQISKMRIRENARLLPQVSLHPRLNLVKMISPAFPLLSRFIWLPLKQVLRKVPCTGSLRDTAGIAGASAQEFGRRALGREGSGLHVWLRLQTRSLLPLRPEMVRFFLELYQTCPKKSGWFLLVFPVN